MIGCLKVNGRNTSDGNPNRGWALTYNGCIIDWVEEGYAGLRALTECYSLSGRFLANVATPIRDAPADYRRHARDHHGGLRMHMAGPNGRWLYEDDKPQNRPGGTGLMPLPKGVKKGLAELRLFVRDQRLLWDFELTKLFRTGQHGVHRDANFPVPIGIAELQVISRIPHEAIRRSFWYPELP